MYKLVFYVPPTHVDAVKTAIFAAGAGHIGHHDHCCWQVLGEGQFRPMDGSQPFLGELHNVEKVAEYRVEMICQEAFISDAVAALKLAHPYEQPAFDVVCLSPIT